MLSRSPAPGPPGPARTPSIGLGRRWLSFPRQSPRPSPHPGSEVSLRSRGPEVLLRVISQSAGTSRVHRSSMFAQPRLLLVSRRAWDKPRPQVRLPPGVSEEALHPRRGRETAPSELWVGRRQPRSLPAKRKKQSQPALPQPRAPGPALSAE